MQQTARPTRTPQAQVISLQEHRARKRTRDGRRSIMRPLVALWFGSAIFAMMALFGFAASVALERPTVGVPVAVAIATFASWQAAGAWLAQRPRQEQGA